MAQPAGQSLDVFETIQQPIALVFRKRRQVVLNANGDPEKADIVVGHGSGFLCDFGNSVFLFTAHHVIRELNQHEYLQMVTRNANGEWFIEGLGNPLVSEPGCDTAIFKLNISAKCNVAAFPEPILELSPRLKVGRKVYFVGFPHVPDDGDYVTIVQEGMIAGHDRRKSGAEYYVMQGMANPGNSGGPVFTATGEVIGIVIQYVPPHQNALLAIVDRQGNYIEVLSKPSGLSLIVPLNFGIDLLRRKLDGGSTPPLASPPILGLDSAPAVCTVRLPDLGKIEDSHVN